MLSHISLILAFALVASGSKLLEGTWRYEAQLVAGNPRLNWNKAGWKLVVPHVSIYQHSDPYNISVAFTDPHYESLNDWLPERTTWSQVDKMNWLKTVIESLKKPFNISFSNGTVSEVRINKNEIKQSADIKMSFTDHLQAALTHKNESKVNETNKGDCNVKIVRTLNDSTSHNIRKVINTVYYKSCDTWKYPIVGVIPKEQHCCDCKNCTRKSSLNSYDKVEVVSTQDTIVSILRQHFIDLPIYEIDSPAYTIYGNVSIIKVKAIPVPLQSRDKVKEQIKIVLNGTHHSACSDKKFKSEFLPEGNTNEVVEIIRAILSENGKPKQGENILMLHDLLSYKKWRMDSIDRELKTMEERILFYSLLTSLENEDALKTLINATKREEVPFFLVPAFLILSSKVTEMSDVTPLYDLSKSFKNVCPFISNISSLAMSIIIRRNNLTAERWLSNNTRMRLAMAGNIGMNIKEKIPSEDVLLKMAYVQSKRSPERYNPEEIIEELIEIFLDRNESTIVRAEAFKVIMNLSCRKTVWSTVFARLNLIDDPVLINYVVSSLKSYASNKLPFYSFMVKRAEEQLPLLKVEPTLSNISFAANHVTLSTYDPTTNMGLAILMDYVIPVNRFASYMSASFEIQPYLLNSLLSVVKVQVLIPMEPLKSIALSLWSMSREQLRNPHELMKVMILEAVESPWSKGFQNTMLGDDVSVSIGNDSLTPKVLELVQKSELKLFNDDMEIAFISLHSSLADEIHSAVSRFNTSIISRIRGVVIPVVVKKSIRTIVGPHLEMSVMNYLTIDSVFELINNHTLSVIPRMSAGLRFMLQSDDRVTISTGTLIKAEIESRNITATYELQGATYRIRTFMPLQVEPIATLEVIPRTGSQIGYPKRSWEKQATPSLRVKSIPIALTGALDDPSIVLNISGKIEKPLNQKWLYALQDPQLLQVSLLPTYKTPSDTIVAELVYSKNMCPPTRHCLVKDDRKAMPEGYCQRLCINAVTPNRRILSEGSTLTVYEYARNGTLNVNVKSRVKFSNDSKIGQFNAEATLKYPSIVRTEDLFNNTYKSELMSHKFNTLRSMQLTLNETEMTRQMEEILSGIYLPESREEGYTDMNKDILILYPELYIRDTLRIPGLHNLFKTSLKLYQESFARRGHKYTPDWDQLLHAIDSLLAILKNPLKKSQPDVVVMQDHVILWCLEQCTETAINYKAACGNCSHGKELLTKMKKIVFPIWHSFYQNSKAVVEEALNESSNKTMIQLVQNVFYTDEMLINLINAEEAHEILLFYKKLELYLNQLSGRMHRLTSIQQRLSKTIMVKLVGFELLKTLGNHWHIDNSDCQKEKVKIETAKTDLAVSFMSVAGRFIIQSCNLLSYKKMSESYGLSMLIKQAIMLVDYNRWLRTVVVDDSQISNLKLATNKLLSETKKSLAILRRLQSDITQDPMIQIFITEVIAVHKITLLKLKQLPKYAPYATKEFDIDEFEWDLIKIMKNLTASYRPISTLKRGFMKYPRSQTQFQSLHDEDTSRKVILSANIEWPYFKINATIVGKKSDSQVVNELQQTTMTKSKSMAKSLERILYNQTYVCDSLLLELNSYQDVCAMVSVKGNVTEEISTTLAILNEKLRTYLLPFDASLSNEDPSAIERECPSNICIRAVSSRDVKKFDLLLRDPKDSMLLLQVPTI